MFGFLSFYLACLPNIMSLSNHTNSLTQAELCNLVNLMKINNGQPCTKGKGSSVLVGTGIGPIGAVPSFSKFCQFTWYIFTFFLTTIPPPVGIFPIQKTVLSSKQILFNASGTHIHFPLMMTCSPAQMIRNQAHPIY